MTWRRLVASLLMIVCLALIALGVIQAHRAVGLLLSGVLLALVFAPGGSSDNRR